MREEEKPDRSLELISHTRGLHRILEDCFTNIEFRIRHVKDYPGYGKDVPLIWTGTLLNMRNNLRTCFGILSDTYVIPIQANMSDKWDWEDETTNLPQSLPLQVVHLSENLANLGKVGSRLFRLDASVAGYDDVMRRIVRLEIESRAGNVRVNAISSGGELLVIERAVNLAPELGLVYTSTQRIDPTIFYAEV